MPHPPCPICKSPVTNTWNKTTKQGNVIRWGYCKIHGAKAIGKVAGGKAALSTKRPALTTNISRQETRIIRSSLDKGVSRRRTEINEWIAKKKADHIAAGLYQKTINGKTYTYRPLGPHLWERTSADGRNRTLIRHLPDNLD